MKEQIETAVPRINFVAGDSVEARKTATGHSCEPLCATIKTTRPTINKQKNERQNANASAKSKELLPIAQTDTVAAHLLLP